MQLDTVAQAAEPVRRASRGLYLPTIAITGLAAWLSWRGWSALAQTGVASSFDDGRFQLAGPVVLGFVLARSVGIFGFKLTFSSGMAYTVLVVEAAGVVMLALTAWLQFTRGRR